MFNRIFFSVIVFVLINSNFTSAQTNELGIFFGGSLFHGDLGFQNSENAFMGSRPSFGINIKRNINYYFGLNLSIKRGIIQAKDSSSEDLFNQNRDLDFRSYITDLSLLFEFNFQPYSSRDSEYNNSFFVYSGVSRFYFNPQRQSENGFWYNLRPLNTEGQGSDFYPGRQPYDLSAFSIPVGVGYKVKLEFTATDATGCSVSSDPAPAVIVGTGSTNGTITIPPVTGNTTDGFTVEMIYTVGSGDTGAISFAMTLTDGTNSDSINPSPADSNGNAVTITADTSAPEISSGEVDESGESITLAFNENLELGSNGVVEGFTFKVGTTVLTQSEALWISDSPSNIFFSLVDTVYTGETVTVDGRTDSVDHTNKTALSASDKGNGLVLGADHDYTLATNSSWTENDEKHQF